ncbi:uncharacterized protein LOC104884869 isoform X2 [Beta vulgaris subsp. vulgaris]|uniref:uncharacterized protein LOC104884869 isoform X2 n=1 Tax=Beta vulgaris subsp. vulgaris TaxID=3555 RepID=UPI0020368C48|nr:uncharacterized protein LOC104884869 isoform X2 [Beta vulgaris subsp. vulgaris]
MTITIQIQSDMRSSLHFSSIFRRLSPSTTNYRHRFPSRLAVKSFSNDAVEKIVNKPSICTADELHYVHVTNSDWRLALWRYHPHPEARARNHPLLLLSGVGTNAIGYDLAPECSFARHMSGQGFDTWILEVRGAGLSMNATHSKDVEQSAHEISDKMESTAEKAKEAVVHTGRSLDSKDGALVDSDVPVINGAPSTVATVWDESELVSKLTDTFMRLSQRLSGFLSEGQSRIISARLLDQLQKLLEDSHLLDRFNETRGKLLSLLETNDNSAVANQITDLSQRLVNIFEEGQRSISPQIFDLQASFFTTVEDFQKQLDLMVKYDWDFDHYLDEDIPAVMEYIRGQSKPKDGKLLAIGHSMGGILLYGMLSRCGYEGKDPRLAAIVTLASSLDYTTSKSSLKMLIPLANPAQVLNVPVVPLGAMLSATYPLSSSPPYVLSWLNNLISAEDMMDPELLKKLVLNNFCTIPAKLLLQLTTAFREGGLCDRSGTFFYKDHLHKSSTPVLALAGDQDLICPPEAVYGCRRSVSLRS